MSCVGCPPTTQGPYHIEVCMSCVGCPLTTQGPCQSHRGVYVLCRVSTDYTRTLSHRGVHVLCWVSTDYTRTLPVTSRCVCLLLGVRRLHKDLASHIQVCMSCVGCPPTTQGPCQSHPGVYVLCWVSTNYTRTLPVTSRCVCLVSGVHRLHKDLITSRCVCLVLGVH